MAVWLPSYIRVVQRDGFGSGDLFPLVFWTFPLALGLMFVGCLLNRLEEIPPLAIRMIIAVVLGGLCGFLWTILVATWMGPWFSAFSFPMAMTWMIGGAIGLLIAEIALRFVTR